MKWSYLVCEWAQIRAPDDAVVCQSKTPQQHCCKQFRLNAILGPISYGLDLSVAVTLCVPRSHRLNCIYLHTFYCLCIVKPSELSDRAGRQSNRIFNWLRASLYHSLPECISTIESQTKWEKWDDSHFKTTHSTHSVQHVVVVVRTNWMNECIGRGVLCIVI